MEYSELDLFFSGTGHKAYLTSGFFHPTVLTFVPHRHLLTEIHLRVSGTSDYEVGGERFTLTPDTLILVPPGTFHRSLPPDDGTVQIAFQVDADLPDFRRVSLPAGTGAHLLSVIRETDEGSHADRLSVWLSVLCAELFPDAGACRARPMQARDFLIREFFARRYAEPITLEDLAAELCLSCKQTARIVRELTGHSFNKELTRKRMEAAWTLMQDGKTPLFRVAELVGYRSYSGFWKAWQAEGNPTTVE